MTESKFKRVTVAVTVGAVLLLVILISVMVYQLISIKNARENNDFLDAEIKKYDLLLDDGKETLESRKQLDWIEYRARELGLIGKLDKIYGK